MRFALLMFLALPAFAAYPMRDFQHRTAAGSTNWVCSSGQSLVYSLQTARASANTTPGFCAWVRDSAPSNAQWFEALVGNVISASTNGGSRGGVGVRIDTSSNNGYACLIESDGTNVVLRIKEITAGSEATLGSSGTLARTSVAVDDRLRVTINGSNQITCELFAGLSGSTTRLTVTPVTDSSFTSGRIGYYVRDTPWTWKEPTGGVLGDPEPPRVRSCEPLPGGKKQCFVSWTGTNLGTGTRTSPLSYDWHFSQVQHEMASGDFVFRDPGTLGNTTWTWDQTLILGLTLGDTALEAKVPAGVTVAAWPGAWTVFDFAKNCSGQFGGWKGLVLSGSGTIKDFTLTNSGTGCAHGCVIGDPMANGYDNLNGVIFAGTNTQATNWIAYNLHQPLLMQDVADGGRARGFVVYNGGTQRPVTGSQAHIAYTDNLDAGFTKYMEEGFLFRHISTVGADRYIVHNFSQTGNGVAPFEFRRLTLLSATGVESGFLFASGGASSNDAESEGIVLDRVRMFSDDTLASATKFRGNVDASALTDFVLTNSYLPVQTELQYTTGSTVTGNVFANRRSGGLLLTVNRSGYFVISSLSRASNTVTVSVSNPIRGFVQTGDQVTITGTSCPSTSANVTVNIASIGNSSFTFAQTGANESCTVTGAIAQFTSPRFDTMPEVIAGGEWDNNTYYGYHAGPFQTQIRPSSTGSGTLSTTDRSFAQWKALNAALDPNSSYNTGVCPAFGATCPDASATNTYYVDPATDETGKAYITAYNWKGLSSGYTVDLSAVPGLHDGDQIELHDIQNLRDWTAAVATLTLDASLTIDIGPYMSLTTIHDRGDDYDTSALVHCGYGGSTAPVSFAHTSSLFGTFAIRRVRASDTRDLSITNPQAGSTHVRLKLGLASGSWDMWPSLTVACTEGNACDFSSAGPVFPGTMWRQYEYLDAEDGSVLASSSITSFSSSSGDPSIGMSGTVSMSGTVTFQ